MIGHRITSLWSASRRSSDQPLSITTGRGPKLPVPPPTPEQHRYNLKMAHRPADSPPGSPVVVTNPDEDCSPAAFQALLDDLLAGPEPELESLDAAEAIRNCAPTPRSDGSRHRRVCRG